MTEREDEVGCLLCSDWRLLPVLPQQWPEKSKYPVNLSLVTFLFGAAAD